MSACRTDPEFADMTLDFSSRRAGVTVAVTALLFAAAFWLLAAGTVLWQSNAGLASAIVPEGGEFLNRLLFATVFGLAGAVAGTALQRSREVESFAVNKLREGERKYHALLASSFDCVLTLSRDGNIVEMSDSAAALFGAGSGELVGRPIDGLLEPDGAADAKATPDRVSELLSAADRQNNDSVGVRAQDRKGRRFPADIRITPMHGGEQSAYVIAIRETTSSVVAQKALRHSERRYQALFDNVPDGVYRSLPDGRLLAANPALVRILGYDSVDDLLSNANTHKFYLDGDERKQLASRLEQHGKARNVEMRLRRRDGKVVAALANIRAVGRESHADVVYEGTLTDISDLLEARAALEDSEEHFRALCEHALDFINVIDADGQIVYSSPSTRQLTGRPPQDQVGLKLFGSVHPDDHSAVTSTVASGFARPGTPQRFTCRVYRHDGALRYLDAVGTAFLTRRGELRAVIHSRDITERIETEAELREMQKIQVVGRLTNGLAHEFNNLLTVVHGNLELLEDHVCEPAQKIYLDSALLACRQGSDLTRRLMAFADRHDVVLEDLNVNGLLMDIEPVLRRSLAETIRIQTDYGDDLWDVRIDTVQFEAAILQIAVNAKEAMGDGGTLTISTKNRSAAGAGQGMPETAPAVDCVCITMSDDGEGMDREVLARATDPFFSTRPAPANTGLGLSAVKRFVEAAGGELRLQSEPGAGTVVCLFLPRILTSEYPVDGPAAVPGGSERVLVVDDNPDVRRASTALLRSLGYRIREAADGHEAINLLRREAFDLLFTDLAMPRLSGLELAALARAEQPGLKVLLTSGNEAASAEAIEGLDSPYELIRKPYRKQGLAEHVRLALES